MKIIDLLNKIANSEEVPKKIGYDNKIFEFDELERQYTFHNLDYSVNDDLGLSIEGLRYFTLNDEVEIIEEDKKIKRILTYTTPDDEDFAYEDGDKPNNVCIYSPIEKLFIKKINELSDEVNKMKEGK